MHLIIDIKKSFVKEYSSSKHPERMSPIYLPGWKVESYFTKLSSATASSTI